MLWSVLVLYSLDKRVAIVVLSKQTPNGAVECTVSLSRRLAIVTLSGILRQAQVTSKEFIENL